jgi:uncharacterized protein (DUF2235 family)
VKRLALFVDGTWNVASNNTNVWRLHLLTAPADEAGTPQETYYHVGVGTDRTNHLRGAFGKGINASVRDSYEWLLGRYLPGDEIFIFGFSRGAFIARSLAGFIDRCGLLKPGTPVSVAEAFEHYKAPVARDSVLARHSRRVSIRFLGVWDTVRYHDLPVTAIRGLGRKANLFHAIDPGACVHTMCQALAIDEHRKEYRPEIWPGVSDAATGVEVEQRWFAGAHSNVGGGYRNDTMALVALAWMQENAASHGLAFKENVYLEGDEHLGPMTDSFATFLGGSYRIVRGNRRHLRPIGVARATASETIDASVFDRWRQDSSYRPENLVEWARRHGIPDPSVINATIDAVHATTRKPIDG